MQSISTIFNIIWGNDLFHWAIVFVFSIATSLESFTCFLYWTQSKKDQNAIKELKRDSKSKKYKEWIDENL